MKEKSLNVLVKQFLSARTLLQIYVGLLFLFILVAICGLATNGDTIFTLVSACLSGVMFMLFFKQKNKVVAAKDRLLKRMTEIHEESVNLRTELQLAKSEFEKNSSGVVAISLEGNMGKPLANAYAFLKPLLRNASLLPELEKHQVMKMNYLSIHKQLLDFVMRVSTASKTLKEEIERNSIDADFGDGF